MAKAPQKSPAQTVTIDGKEYEHDKLSDAARTQIENIRFCNQRLEQLTNELAVADTARLGYGAALKRELADAWPMEPGTEAPPTINIDGRDYDTSNLSERARQLLASYRTATAGLEEAVNMRAILTRAKNSYIADLKSEIVAAKTGVDLSSLFSDD